MRIWSAFLGACALGLALAASPAGANSRALLIGVGNVKGYPLPGIDVDLDNMHQVAIILGFKPEDIKTLHDADATLKNVSEAINGWVLTGVKPDDHVLIYFSGHGTRMSDPKSAHGVDDALVMSDAEFAHGQIHGLLLGRELGAAIAKNPSHNVLVLVDACHSGSATRDLPLDNLSLGVSRAVKRFFIYPGMPDAPPATRGLVVTRATDIPAGNENYAALSAAADNETASGTEQGGMFTLGITGDIQEASREGKHPTVEDLRVASTNYIAAHLKPQDASHPVADGNQRLIRGELALIPLRDGHGPTWQSLAELAGKGQPLKVSETTGHAVHVGDEVVLNIEIPSAGYLNVVTVDSQDRAEVLFPNKIHPANQVTPGTFSIPGPQSDFIVRAQEPTGPSLVVAFLTDREVNLLDLGVEGRDVAGRMKDNFTKVSGRATRALTIESRERQTASGTFTVLVEPAKH